MHHILEEYPFQIQLSFEPLVKKLEELRKTAHGAACLRGAELDKWASKAPKLSQPIADRALLGEHQETLHQMIGFLFPPVYWESEALAVLTPLVMEPVITSPLFSDMFVGLDGCLHLRRNVGEADFDRGRVIKAFLFILQKVYGIERKLEYPLICTAKDPQSGLDRFFHFHLDFQFVEVSPANGFKPLSDAELERVLNNVTRPEVLREIINPADYVISGFTAVQAVDVTENEVVSSIERDLIDQQSIVSNQGFQRLQNRLQVYFKRPDMGASLSAVLDDQVLLLNIGHEIKKSCLFGDSMHMPLTAFEDTIYGKIDQSDEVILVPDVSKEPGLEGLREGFLEADAHSMMIAPLHFQGQCLGALTVKTSTPGDLGPMDALMMTQLQPMFSMAINKALLDIDTQIQTIIKQECTAIHPSVEWRFRGAAFKLMEARRRGLPGKLEPIIFRDVYPLYASADIRGSSDERNRAVAGDLGEHLDMGREAVIQAGKAAPMPFLEELASRIDRLKERLEGGLSSGDEALIINFLRNEVESIFGDIQGLSPETDQAVKTYRENVDQSLGTVYRRRRQFEQSVQDLNDSLTAYLDAEEEAMQLELPHYFERHRTDGVDYIVYAGSSMLEHGRFNSLHLKNLRLWQIMVSCGLVWHTERLKSSLPIPLDTAHLILIQNNPLSIRFRYDEKRFDVDGAYDVRYEIIRSRLDKAVVKENGQRLTQPGKVALVYSHPAEGREIMRHLEFLQAKGFLTGEAERLSLGDLPGVQGLKAIRAKVDLESKALAQRAGAISA